MVTMVTRDISKKVEKIKDAKNDRRNGVHGDMSQLEKSTDVIILVQFVKFE
jgi:hypothetical protein